MQDTKPSVDKTPNVGRKEKQPFHNAGLSILPVVSDPMAISNYSYAAIAAPLPLLLPPED